MIVNEYRMVIDLMKKRIEQGKLDNQEISEAILKINMAIDKSIIHKESITELLKLKTDLEILKFY